jgi:uncharacterized coiled-coil protein SlyX
MKISNHEIHEPRKKPISFRRRLDFAENRGKLLFMADEISQRLEKLESHLAHLEHQVEQLNDVLTEQSQLVEHLKKQVQRQSGVLETIEMERIKSNNPKPPHH